MQLTEYLTTYLLEHDLKPTYVKHLHATVRVLDTFTNGVPLEEITAEHLNLWADSLAERLAKRTIRNKLSSVMTLLRSATEDGSRGPLVGRVKKLRVRGEPVRAFTIEEIGRLLQAAEGMPGWYERTGICRADWWVAIIHTAWDTAMRIGDLLDLQWRDFREHDGGVAVVKTQSKTGRPIVARLRPQTWAAIEKLRNQGRHPEYVFLWVGWKNKFSMAFKRVAERAGVAGTPKYLRRARATAECRRFGPAAAGRVLGHADGTGQLAMRNYVDLAQLDAAAAMPPELPTAPAVVLPVVVNGNGKPRERPAVTQPKANGHVNGQASVNGANGTHQQLAAAPTDETWESWV